MSALQQKRISRFRRGRVSAAKEHRKQLRIRNKLERQLLRRLTSLFGKFVNTRAYLFMEFGQYAYRHVRLVLIEQFNSLSTSSSECSREGSIFYDIVS